MTRSETFRRAIVVIFAAEALAAPSKVADDADVVGIWRLWRNPDGGVREPVATLRGLRRSTRAFRYVDKHEGGRGLGDGSGSGPRRSVEKRPRRGGFRPGPRIREPDGPDQTREADQWKF